MEYHRSEPINSHWVYATLGPPQGGTKKEAEDPTAEMNELAAEGWRLVETIDYTGGGTKFLVFKRPVPSVADWSEERDQS